MAAAISVILPLVPRNVTRSTPGEAEVFHQANFAGELVVVGGDGAAFERIEEFGGVKTEDFTEAEISDGSTVERAAEGMGGIVNEREAMLGGELLEGGVIAGLAPDVHADDAGGARRNQASRLGGVKVVGAGCDVAEDGSDLLPLQGVRSGDEGEGRDDDFAFKFGRANCDFKGDGGVADGDAMADAEGLLELLFELLDDRAEISEPTAIHDFVNAAEERFLGTDIRAAHVEGFAEMREACRDS